MKKKKLTFRKETLRALEGGPLEGVAGGMIIIKKPAPTPQCVTVPCTSTSNCPPTGDSVYDCTYLCTVCEPVHLP